MHLPDLKNIVQKLRICTNNQKKKKKKKKMKKKKKNNNNNDNNYNNDNNDSRQWSRQILPQLQRNMSSCVCVVGPRTRITRTSKKR